MHIQPILSRLYEDHRKILQALRDHDPKSAEEAFYNHNRQMLELIKKEVEAGRWHELDSNMG